MKKVISGVLLASIAFAETSNNVHNAVVKKVNSLDQAVVRNLVSSINKEYDSEKKKDGVNARRVLSDDEAIEAIKALDESDQANGEEAIIDDALALLNEIDGKKEEKADPAIVATEASDSGLAEDQKAEASEAETIEQDPAAIEAITNVIDEALDQDQEQNGVQVTASQAVQDFMTKHFPAQQADLDAKVQEISKEYVNGLEQLAKEFPFEIRQLQDAHEVIQEAAVKENEKRRIQEEEEDRRRMQSSSDSDDLNDSDDSEPSSDDSEPSSDSDDSSSERR